VFKKMLQCQLKIVFATLLGLTVVDACDRRGELDISFCQQFRRPPPNDPSVHPHPTDCQSEVWCYNDGGNCPMFCPPNLFFDIRTTICRPRNEAQCLGEPDPDDYDDYYNYYDDDDIDEKCPQGRPNEITFIPSTERCDRYFICFNRQSTQRECSNGIILLKIRKRCKNF
jgi:Chitin binding Peritrophin-A domain